MKGKLNIYKKESLSEFERRNFMLQKSISEQKPFRFFSSADCSSDTPILYMRRDFYKVSLLEGDYIVHYGDESIKTSGTSLSFFSPHSPYTIKEIEERENAGYFIFTETFYDTYFKFGIKSFPLFDNKKKPIFLLNNGQIQMVKDLFGKIEYQNNTDYPYKYDLIRNYTNELMHYANNLQPASERHHQFTAKERLLNVFYELLDRQFPADENHAQELRSPSYFADSLSVHVNYLNRVLKELTGKSTSELLYDRLLKESIILLKHTDWSISEVAYKLGFNDTSHFNHFFKKQTNQIPSSYRSL
ncbi:helix-turn-helix transcriptional regulator [Fulvivirga maritima]|uniref:helix-turn-helix domain-containing protein n=1 Tax=Fulvivirga maritima TaxID=2904247 RepID=UPI001F175EAF|nr:helix-turn-helix domain-containing protein [Fulvivirga maritima]UII26737.1 helix-turn-helix transcriptional regulator [Fulvivirga maritima]